MKIVRPVDITAAVLTASSITENDYGAWSAATSYASGVRVIQNHHIYESLQAANLNHDPASSPTWWNDLGATNRWRMFDSSINSLSTATDSITVTLHPTTRIDTVALLNVSAETIRIKATSATDGVVYDKTTAMIDNMGITDWYAYFYEPIEAKNDLIITDLPLYSGLTVEITISNQGNSVACGCCIIGYSKEIGGAQYGASVGIQDYSIKTQDAWGNYQIVERAYRKRASFTVWTGNSFIDQLQRLLAGYRAVPILYLGSDQYSCTAVYGFYKDFSIEISYQTVSICSIEIEGLT